MKSNVFAGRFIDARVMPNGVTKLIVKANRDSSLVIPKEKLVVSEKEKMIPKELEHRKACRRFL